MNKMNVAINHDGKNVPEVFGLDTAVLHKKISSIVVKTFAQAAMGNSTTIKDVAQSLLNQCSQEEMLLLAARMLEQQVSEFAESPEGQLAAMLAPKGSIAPETLDKVMEEVLTDRENGTTTEVADCDCPACRARREAEVIGESLSEPVESLAQALRGVGLDVEVVKVDINQLRNQANN